MAGLTRRPLLLAREATERALQKLADDLGGPWRAVRGGLGPVSDQHRKATWGNDVEPTYGIRPAPVWVRETAATSALAVKIVQKPNKNENDFNANNLIKGKKRICPSDRAPGAGAPAAGRLRRGDPSPADGELLPRVAHPTVSLDGAARAAVSRRSQPAASSSNQAPKREAPTATIVVRFCARGGKHS